jgi:hypothetical protein
VARCRGDTSASAVRTATWPVWSATLAAVSRVSAISHTRDPHLRRSPRNDRTSTMRA